jgi:hypothetical protein
MKTKEEIRQFMKENGYEEITKAEYNSLDDEGECRFDFEEKSLFFKPTPLEEKEALIYQIQDIIMDWEWDSISSDEAFNKIDDIIKEFKIKEFKGE